MGGFYTPGFGGGMMGKFAVVCASGIGDGLLMQIAAKQLISLGHEVVTFSNHLNALSGWFPGMQFYSQPPPDKVEELFSSYDAVLLQHDNTPKARKIRGLNKPIYTLYGAHLISKHGQLRKGFDVQFAPDICMAENISMAMQILFPELEEDVSNGIVPPEALIHRHHNTRVAIHPTSTSEQKNWPRHSFLKLRDLLVKGGWEPVFIVPPEEAAEWGAPLFPTLAELAAFLYESGYLIGNDSGPGHLASNLGLPTVIIGPSKEHLSLWRPGWHQGEIVYPPSWTSNFKLTRQNWKMFIPVNHVFKQFKKLTDIK